MNALDADALARALSALGEPTRLRLVALLARRPHYGEELAEALGLSRATVSHHLKILRTASLVRSHRDTPYVSFELDHDVLEALTSTLETPDALGESMGLPSEESLIDRRLRQWLDEDGKLVQLPTSRRDLTTVLRWAAMQLETGRLYPDRELRFVLLDLAHDPDALREELVRHGWLQRAGTVYRRNEEARPQ